MLTGTQPWSRARTKALFDEEQQFVAPGLQTIALLSELAIERGAGCALVDIDGNTYLDLNAGVSAASLGHAHPAYVRALTEQLQQVSVGSFASRPRAAFARLLAEVAPGNLSRVQFFSGGAEAVEAAIRLARSYTGRRDIVGFTGGFHGKTAGVLPISDVAWKHEVGPLPTGYHLAPFPDPTRGHRSPAECLASAIAALEKVVDTEAGGHPAAIIVEPIQGTAGNIIPPAGFLGHVQEVARRCGALLIVDEMITGFGRTGLMFASTHEAVVPDIMTLGKGMAGGFPMSAVLSTDDIVQAKPFSLPSASSSSFGGNPLAAAAGLVTLTTIIEEGLVEHASRVGRMLLEGLASLAARHRRIANVRGAGLLVGFDLVRTRTAGRDTVDVDEPRALLAVDDCVTFFRECLAGGLILMGYTPRVRIHPPLVLSSSEVERAVSIIDHALARIDAC